MDKKGLNEIRTQLRKTRRMYETAQDSEFKLFYLLDKLGVNLDQDTDFAPNAETLGTSITCYLNYGESNEDDVMSAIAAAAEDTE